MECLECSKSISGINSKQDKWSLKSQALYNQIWNWKKREIKIAWLTEITIKYQNLTDCLTLTEEIALTDW